MKKKNVYVTPSVVVINSIAGCGILADSDTEKVPLNPGEEGTPDAKPLSTELYDDIEE